MLDLPTFTLIHVLLSVFGLIAGLVVAGGLISGARLDGWTAFFLATTVATSITGYGFPADKVLPSHIVGGISLVVLAICLWARYGQKMSGSWRRTYVVTAVTALYLNAFVLMVQLFVKTPALQKLAPTQQEAPFALTQGLVLLLFVWIGWKASRGFRG
jgi:hypothetical protein